MERQWLVALVSALMGGLIGGVAAGAGTSWLSNRREMVASDGNVAATRRVEVIESKLLERVASIERSLRALETRRDPAAPGVHVAQNGAVVRPVFEEDDRARPSIGDPVFEAAVLDVLERAEEQRDSERDDKRSERARQRAEHWANDLTMQLGLSPAQTARLLEIQSQLGANLREQRQSSSEGKYVPRERRRALNQTLRERADREVREVLDPRQLSEYDKLDRELKLVRSND